MNEEIFMEEMEMEMDTFILPQEILMEILSRLPAKSLLSSFKLVCKAWCTLIHDPAFVMIHLNRRRSISNNYNSLICKSAGNEFFQLHPPFNFQDFPPTATKLDDDFDSLSSSYSSCSRLIGSCNGLLCISVTTDETIILLNPSTRRYKVSPTELIERHPNLDHYRFVTYGFGCCSNSTINIDEYKVIRIAFFSRLDNGKVSSFRYQFDIYVMSSHSWRRMTFSDYPCVISGQQSGVFVNGALHWMGGVTLFSTSRIGDTIVSFDIRDEEFRQVPIPLSCHPTTDNDPYFHMKDMILMNMKGCLSIICFFDLNISTDVDLEIWVMKESWAKEFVIRTSESDPPRAFGVEIYWRSAYILKGDQILIEGWMDTNQGSESISEEEGYRGMVLYDINERKVNGDFTMTGVPEPDVDQVDYIETLVSLKSSLLQ